MAAQVLADLTAEVNQTTGIMASATALIDGFGAKLQAAVDAAIANGATEAELAPLNDLVTALDTEGNKLATAVANNP